MSEFERHCANCGYPLNLAISTICDDCGMDNVVYEEVFARGSDDDDVIIHVNKNQDGSWGTFYLLTNRETGQRTQAQVMLSTGALTLPDAVKNVRKALTENPEAWGLCQFFEAPSLEWMDEEEKEPDLDSED